MPNDYYGGEEDIAPTAPPEETETEDTSNEQTAVIPKSLCPGMKEGDKIELTIAGVHEDSYEVKYTPKGDSESPEEMPGKGMMEDEGEMY